MLGFFKCPFNINANDWDKPLDREQVQPFSGPALCCFMNDLWAQLWRYINLYWLKYLCKKTSILLPNLQAKDFAVSEEYLHGWNYLEAQKRLSLELVSWSQCPLGKRLRSRDISMASGDRRPGPESRPWTGDQETMQLMTKASGQAP